MEILGGNLLSGAYLLPGQTLVSVGGRARLHYQADGNLVIYLNGIPVWASQTAGYGAGKMTMRRDGNLVLSDGVREFASSVTQGHLSAMAQLQDDGNLVIYENPTSPQAGTPIWASASSEFEIGPVVPEPGPEPPGPGEPTDRPLVGPLRINDKLFRDDLGWRRVHFCSWFPALRILRDTPGEFYRQIDSIAAHGYQGFRTFLAVGGWDNYWNGREVAPIRFQKWTFGGNHLRPGGLSFWVEAWPDYDDLLRTLLRACRSRKLRLHVTTGDMQIICPTAADKSRELDLHRRFARICAEEGGLDVVALAEATNEFPLNRYGGESQESIDQMGQILAIWSTAIPGICTAQGAIPQNEEPAALSKASTFGNVCAVHVTRSPFETALKRTHALIHWEGNWRAFPKPFWEGEPAGPGADSYQPMNDPAQLTALYAMQMLTGQASVWFQGAAVRSFAPLESEWGFSELPRLFTSLLPEDIALWNRETNTAAHGVQYWTKGQEFATALAAGWNPEPPRPVATWALYTGVGVTHGTGRPPSATGLLVGTFAG